MDGIARATGAGVPIKWDGVDYVLNGLTLEDYGILKNYLLEQKRNQKIDFVLKLKDKLPQHLYEKHLDKAIEEAASIEDVEDETLDVWLNTIEGASRSVWLALDRRYPGKVPYEAILRKLQEEIDSGTLKDELIAKRDMATGVDKAGNSLGLDAQKEVQAEEGKSIGTN